jgi:4-hydroxy-4-methyl-2-oxoglutarate aldolase
MSKRMVAPVSSALTKSFRQLSTSVLSDAMRHTQCMHSVIRPLVPGSAICGQAYTVRCYPGDNLMCHYAVSQASEGDVLVVDGGGNTEVALWGSLLSLSAAQRNLGGTIIDGAVRDIEELRQIGYAIYARNVTPRSGFKAHAGEVNLPVSCGGVVVCDGDMVVADADGVVVIPFANVQDVANKAAEIAKKEFDVVARIQQGATTYETLGLAKLIGK